jgi:16S rRNA C967 or C1407 C5-methylase (RsmB/RsmF family)
MGRHQRKNRFQKKNANRPPRPARQQGTEAKEEGRNFVLTTVAHGNFGMETYYAVQGLHNQRWNEQGELVDCVTHEERDAERLRWRKCIGEILPASFRISKLVPRRLQEQMEQELQELLQQVSSNNTITDNSSTNTTPAALVRQLSFVPHAYQMTLDRATLRKLPELAPVHQWMQRHTANGNITRQETVSMIPPLVLQVQPTDACLDMCAAPGSKTSQMWEDLGPHGCCTYILCCLLHLYASLYLDLT